jgi:hypothetical protein
MRKRVFNKLRKRHLTTFDRIGDHLVPRMLKNYKHIMKMDKPFRKEVRKVVTKVLMGEKV